MRYTIRTLQLPSVLVCFGHTKGGGGMGKWVILRGCSVLSEMTNKFTGQPIFGKIKCLVAREINNGQPSQTEKIN